MTAPGASSPPITCRVAKPDGLTIGHFNGALFLGQVLGQPGIEFDARSRAHRPSHPEDAVCAMTRASGITSARNGSRRRRRQAGRWSRRRHADANARILKAALGLPIQLVSGYKGTQKFASPRSSGELPGLLVMGVDALEWRSGLDTGEVVAVCKRVQDFRICRISSLASEVR